MPSQSVQQGSWASFNARAMLPFCPSPSIAPHATSSANQSSSAADWRFTWGKALVNF
jgi:hypothetical protein